MRPATVFEILYNRRGEKGYQTRPCSCLSRLVLGWLYDLSCSGRTLSDGAFSIIFFFWGERAVRSSSHRQAPVSFCLPILPVCLGLLRDEQQPATRGDATVIEFMRDAARSHAGAGWLLGWLADEQAAWRRRYCCYCRYRYGIVTIHSSLTTPFSPPQPAMSCDGRLPQGHIRAVLLLLLLLTDVPVACLLCQRRSDLGGHLADQRAMA